MKRKLGKRLRSIMGILLTLGIFAFILLAINFWLGWPTSLLTLGAMLGIAWFFSMFAGEQLTPPGLGTTAASCLAVALAVSIIGFGVPWRLGEENVRFDYRAMFTYLGSKDDTPLENLFLRFPAPHIENEAPDVHSPAWSLYYVENDNILTLQATSTEIYQLKGERMATLGILTQILEPQTDYGSMITYELDRLYFREVFFATGIISVPQSKVDDLTLQVYGDPSGWAAAYWYTPKSYEENKTIDFSFVAGIYRENTLVERYEVFWENQVWGWYALARTI